jgi:hypothetical protein
MPSANSAIYIYIYIYIYICWLCGNVKPPGTNIPGVPTMRRRAPCIMTKEFLPGLIGTQRLTHDMSIPRKRTPCEKNCSRRDEFALISMGLANQARVWAPMPRTQKENIRSKELLCPRQTARQAKVTCHDKAKDQACKFMNISCPNLRRRASATGYGPQVERTAGTLWG